jgi:hypothetical protein
MNLKTILNSKYRTLYFLVGTVGVGLLIIFIMYHGQLDRNTPPSPAAMMATGGHNGLEAKIANMDLKSFSPALYNALLLEINTGNDQKLFNADIQKMLLEQLRARYEELAYQKLTSLMAANSLDYEQINTLVKHLESSFGTNKRLSSIQSNLKAIEYYAVGLPQKISAFIALGFGGFEEETYNKLMKELNGAPDHLKNRKLIAASLNQASEKLKEHYKKYIDWSIDVSL